MSTVSRRTTEIVIDADDGTFGIHIQGGQAEARDDGSRPGAIVIGILLRQHGGLGQDALQLVHGNSLATLRQLRSLIGEALAEAERAGLV